RRLQNYLGRLLSAIRRRFQIGIIRGPGPFTLAGVACLRDGRPAFVIPYFKLEGGPLVFVQELDDDFRILRFTRFKPEHYYNILFTRQKIVRNVGEVGVLGYVDASNRVLIGEPDELRRSLAATDIPKDRAVFFNLGVGMFLRDRERV